MRASTSDVFTVRKMDKYNGGKTYSKFSRSVLGASSRPYLVLYQNFSKPLWDVILYMVSDVPLPTPGKDLEIPPTPEPGLSTLRGEILKLLYPNETGIDQMKAGLGWHCELTDEQFIAVKELRHLISLCIWEELRRHAVVFDDMI
uniref:Uncharacterized protein n=1 Tax=Salix viminalis TaxID=40686 RepID=A0A6N2M319_SALVM